MADSTQHSDNIQDNSENAPRETQDSQESTDENKETNNKDEDIMETSKVDMTSEEKNEITKESNVETMDVDEETVPESPDEVQGEDVTDVAASQKESSSDEVESENIEKQDTAKDDDYDKETEAENDRISGKSIEDEDKQQDANTEKEGIVANEDKENSEDQNKQDHHVIKENKDSNTDDVQSNVSEESSNLNTMEIDRNEDKEIQDEDKEPCVENIEEENKTEENSNENKDNEDKSEEHSEDNKNSKTKDVQSNISVESSNLNTMEVDQSEDKEIHDEDKEPGVENIENEDETEEHSQKNKENEDKSEEHSDENKKGEDKSAEHSETQKENTDKDEDEANTEKARDKSDDGVNKDDANEIASEELSPLSKEKDNVLNEQDLDNRNNDNSDDVSMNDENSIFVQMNNEKDDSEKSTGIAEQVSNDVDPIGSSDWCQSNENNENTFISDLDDADECIIPDTNRDESISIDNSKEPDTTLNSTTQAATPSTENERMKLSEKYLVSVVNTEEESDCMICNKKKVCKYTCTKDEDKTSICSEDCLSKLKEQHTDNVIVRQLRVKNFSLDKTLQTSSTDETTESAKITCKTCFSVITDVSNSLSWESLDFCNEQCLTKHQKLIGSYCANCRIEVKENFLGKYCVRFGYNVRQFCSGTCLEQYKKNSKVCSYCQDDISGNTSGFLTSIGDKGMSKDFCSAQCMQNYNEISKHLKGGKIYDKCYVCHKNNVIEIEFDFKNKDVLFCSDPCFVAFKYVNDVNPVKCDMCCKYYISKTSGTDYLIRYDGVFRKFCQKTCQNIYITTNRKIVSCCWCKVKKYNFDMIQKYSADSSVLIVCSLTCLNFFNASINVSKIKRKRCDFCHKICKGQYHITLADDSMKNFCSYPCVQEYQTKYILAPARYTEQPVAVSSNTNVRVTRKSSGIQQAHRKQIIPDVPGPLPIITSVRSLAPTANASNTRSMRSKASTHNKITTLTSLQTESPPVRRIIVLRPPEFAQQRNVATLVKPITADVEVEFKPVMVDKSVQTEDIKDSLVLVPIPVPIYVPMPMQMYNLLYPKPMPFPLPIPIPMFIPITKQTSNVVLKEIKKNHKNTPTDPYEADLLMMAELVAGENEKKENVGESDVEADTDGDNAAEPSFSPEPQDGSNTFGEDMLQMALKMASDFEEPAVDLEGALTASTITATSVPNEQVDDVAPIQPPVERTTFRGRKRGRPPRHGGRGRGRGRPPTQPEIIIPVEPEPQPPPEPVEKPDANMCLKYTFGVNAWKQWVTTKNAELEKSSPIAKPFKADLLQLTSDELNYSLCLFVKEVRKPNGAEYAPDTIYYLCLGIQQYLYENGRIDNIFCDSYYESFTECLDEVCRKFSTLYNDSQYIVTRVEEEHLWESKQLGAHSPHVLLSTLMFFNTKHFNLTNVEEHMQLSFSHIMKHWKRVPNQPGTPKNSSSRNILLRFYPPQSAVEGNNRKKKVYEQQENEENPLRCPVKLYEFYLSKCPESVKTRNDVFYLLPERSCVPDSPVWYSTMALGKDALEKMLHRVKMVKEINVALLAS